MMYGNAPIVGILKDATICGSRVTYVRTAMNGQVFLAGDVALRKMCQSNTMRTDTARAIGVIPATRVTGIHTGETDILIPPMQVKD